MSPFRKIVALLLALVWLPATLHCGLEAAGVFEHADACCHHEAMGDVPSHCSADSCGIVESGDYQPTQSLLKTSAPVAVVCFTLLIQSAAERAAVIETTAAPEVESPPEMRKTWQFIVRAALSPRAPSACVS